MGMKAILTDGSRPFVQIFHPPLSESSWRNLKKIGPGVSKEKLFKGVDGRTTKSDHNSSTWAFSSGKLKKTYQEIWSEKVLISSVFTAFTCLPYRNMLVSKTTALMHKVPITTAADDILNYFYIICIANKNEPSAYLITDMKSHIFFWKWINNKKNI